MTVVERQMLNFLDDWFTRCTCDLSNKADNKSGPQDLVILTASITSRNESFEKGLNLCRKTNGRKVKSIHRIWRTNYEVLWLQGCNLFLSCTVIGTFPKSRDSFVTKMSVRNQCFPPPYLSFGSHMPTVNDVQQTAFFHLGESVLSNETKVCQVRRNISRWAASVVAEVTLNIR